MRSLSFLNTAISRLGRSVCHHGSSHCLPLGSVRLGQLTQCFISPPAGAWQSSLWPAGNTSQCAGLWWGHGPDKPAHDTASQHRTPPPLELGPSAPQTPHSRSAYGHAWVDEYSWMEGARPSADMSQLLSQEVAHYRRTLQQLGVTGLKQKLMREMEGAWEEAEQPPSPPEVWGAYLYYTQDDEGGGVALLRRRAPPAAHSSNKQQQLEDQSEEEVVLDSRVVQHDVSFVHRTTGLPLGTHAHSVKLSGDQRVVAYTVPLQHGVDRFTAIVRDIKTGALLPGGVIPGVSSIELSADGGALLYSTPDDSGRPCKVFLQQLGPASEAGSSSSSLPAPLMLHHEHHPDFFIELGRTKDCAFLVVNINAKTSSEVHLLPAHLSSGSTQLPALRCVQLRRPGLEYFVEHHAGHLLLLTTHQAPPRRGYTLMRARCSEPHWGMAHWQPVPAALPQDPDGALVDFDVFDGWCALYERRADGRPGVSVLKLTGQSQQQQQQQQPLLPVPLPPWALHLSAGLNQDPAATHLRLTASSPVHPPRVLEFDVISGQVQELGEGSDHDPGRDSGSSGIGAGGVAPNTLTAAGGQYAWRRLHATSSDGTQVPMTLITPCGWEAGSSPPRPVLLLAYGAYGQSHNMQHDPNLKLLLSRGYLVAYAHVRGGGELGRWWHAAGRQLKRPHAHEDYLACVDLLLEGGYTRSGWIAGHATSAGALLLGDALNQRPHAFGAAVLRVPFLDLVSIMCNANLPLTVHEYEEWGNPGAGHGAPDQDQHLSEAGAPGLSRAGSSTRSVRDSSSTGGTHRNVSGSPVLAMMMSLCPYHNVLGARQSALARCQNSGRGDAAPAPAPAPSQHELQALPPVLLSCSLNDARVPFWAAVKWAARARRRQGMVLQQLQPVSGSATRDTAPCSSSSSVHASVVTRARNGIHQALAVAPVILRVHDDRGHYGSDEQEAGELAEDYAFILSAMPQHVANRSTGSQAS